MAAVRAALAEHARDGNLVYHGLAGGLLLRSLPGVLRVRLIAPLDFRIHALMETHGMDRHSAEAYIQDVDDARARWVKDVYGQDISDSNLYDMVLNLASFTIPEACQVVVAAASRPEFGMNPDRLNVWRTSAWPVRCGWHSWKTWEPRHCPWMPACPTGLQW